MIDTATSPEFVTVAETGPPRAPTVVDGNCSVDGAIEIVRASARPVPAIVAVADAPSPLTTSEALDAPVAVGLNATVMTHDPPGGTIEFEQASATVVKGAASAGTAPIVDADRGGIAERDLRRLRRRPDRHGAEIDRAARGHVQRRQR